MAQILDPAAYPIRLAKALLAKSPWETIDRCEIDPDLVVSACPGAWERVVLTPICLGAFVCLVAGVLAHQSWRKMSGYHSLLRANGIRDAAVPSDFAAPALWLGLILIGIALIVVQWVV